MGKVSSTAPFFTDYFAGPFGRSMQLRPGEAPNFSSINPHSPSTLCGVVAFSRLFNEMSLSYIALSCPLDFMSCSVALEVMPHSATSRATGDDISTIVDWNSGVSFIHPTTWV